MNSAGNEEIKRTETLNQAWIVTKKQYYINGILYCC